MEGLRLENPPEKSLTVRTLQLHPSIAHSRNCVLRCRRYDPAEESGGSGRLESKQPRDH